MAFTQNTTPTAGKQPQNGKCVIQNADGQNNKVLYQAGANGSRTASITAVSSDTVNRDVQIIIVTGGSVSGGTVSGGTGYILGTVSVGSGAGISSGTVGVNMLNTTAIPGLASDSDGNPFLNLAIGDVLAVSAVTTVTSGKTIYVTASDVFDF
jgi:hypothetical protein